MIKNIDVKIESEDVIDYMTSIDKVEFEKILKVLRLTDKNIGDGEVKTLDGEFRLELLMKLYRASDNLVDLENMLTDDAKKRIEFIV
jgi:hypothetical protein